MKKNNIVKAIVMIMVIVSMMITMLVVNASAETKVVTEDTIDEFEVAFRYCWETYLKREDMEGYFEITSIDKVGTDTHLITVVLGDAAKEDEDYEVDAFDAVMYITVNDSTTAYSMISVLSYPDGTVETDYDGDDSWLDIFA